jgi:hypothetical protein
LADILKILGLLFFSGLFIVARALKNVICASFIVFLHALSNIVVLDKQTLKKGMGIKKKLNSFPLFSPYTI